MTWNPKTKEKDQKDKSSRDINWEKETLGKKKKTLRSLNSNQRETFSKERKKSPFVSFEILWPLSLERERSQVTKFENLVHPT